MSKIIKPLLNEDGTQVKRKLVKGDWYYLDAIDKYEEWVWEEVSPKNICIYYAEKWKPKENDKYYYYNVYFGEAISTYYVEDSLFHQINIETGNCFRTREEAEQADIQVILDNLKQYYKNKEAISNETQSI